MSATVIPILIAAICGGALVWWLLRLQHDRREAFQALAVRRGWSLTITQQSLGRPSVLRLASRSGPGWQAEARRLSTSTGSGRHNTVTEFSIAEPRWTDGTLIVGPGMSPTESAMVQNLTDQLDTVAGRHLLGRLVGGELPETTDAGLHLYPVSDGLTVLASADPTARVDFDDLAQRIAGWDRDAAGDKGHPIVILGPKGLRVRLRHGTGSADRMEAFIDFALDLARQI